MSSNLLARRQGDIAIQLTIDHALILRGPSPTNLPQCLSLQSDGLDTLTEYYIRVQYGLRTKLRSRGI